MNKTELVAALAEKSNVSKKDAEAVLKAFMEVVPATVKGGDKVQLIGFGTFSLKETPAREGINPATKAKIAIPAKQSLKFKAGKGVI